VQHCHLQATNQVSVKDTKMVIVPKCKLTGKAVTFLKGGLSKDRYRDTCTTMTVLMRQYYLVSKEFYVCQTFHSSRYEEIEMCLFLCPDLSEEDYYKLHIQNI